MGLRWVSICIEVIFSIIIPPGVGLALGFEYECAHKATPFLGGITQSLHQHEPNATPNATLMAMTHQPTQLLSRVGSGPVGVCVIGVQLDFPFRSIVYFPTVWLGLGSPMSQQLSWVG